LTAQLNYKPRRSTQSAIRNPQSAIGNFRLAGILAALLVASSGLAQPSTSLISLTSQVWRYNDSGTDLGSAWRANSYPNENLWRSGIGLFGVETSVPYPYPVPIRTPLILGGGRITYYFRTHFNFSGSQSNLSLFATGYIDDGAVFYLNGQEAGRVRLTSNPVTFSSKAQLASPEGVPSTVEFSTTNLVLGDNVVAVEVHQSSDTSADIVFGLSLDAIGSEPPVITNPDDPADRTVPEGESTTLTVAATGFPPPVYQWFKNDVAIPGATEPSLSLLHASAVDTGRYYLRITNSSGNITSRTAVVTVLLDTNAPTILYALGLPDPTQVLIVFSEAFSTPVTVQEAEDGFNWNIAAAGNGDALVVLGGTLVNGTNLFLSTVDPREENTAYIVQITGQIEDDFGNIIPAGTQVPIALFETALIPIDQTKPWRYNQSGTDLGTSWLDPAYDDSTWLEGRAPFDALRSFETGSACRAVLPVTGGAVGTCLTLSNADNSAQIPAVYFRTHFKFEGDAAHSVLRLTNIVDDGAVYYLNGVEFLRLGMPAGRITYDTLAERDVGDATRESIDVAAPSLVAGDNVLAVELHQYSLTSPALTFALSLTGVVPALPVAHPRLTIHLQGGSCEIDWSPASGTLEYADDLLGPWTTVAPGGTPGQYVSPASDLKKFFRVVTP